MVADGETSTAAHRRGRQMQPEGARGGAGGGSGPGFGMRKRSGQSTLVMAAACGAGALAGLPAAAQQVLVQGEAAHLAVEPITADATLGSRAQLAAQLGAVQTSLTAVVERGGGQLSSTDAAWTSVVRPASWGANDMRFTADWTPLSGARLSLDAGDRERRTLNYTDPLGYSDDAQLAVDAARYLRLHLAAQLARLETEAGAETSTTALDTRTAGAGPATQLWVTSRRIFTHLVWRPSPRVGIEAGQALQAYDVGWRGAGAKDSSAAYVTPDVALTVTPWIDARWRVDVEETVSPIDPAKFAAYAQLATPGGGSAPQPDHGWRYGLSLEQQLPGGIKLAGRATQWRLASVTDLGPVGGGEAPVSIGGGARQELALDVAAPLAPLGLAGTTLAGELSLRRSQVLDPFTGLRRPISGEAPYRAQVRLSGGLAATDLSWSLVAKADGPQSLYQMSQVTSLGATTGLDGALNYDAGHLRISLELDNLVGGARQVTTYSWSGSRADGGGAEVGRRDDDSRAVRISLRRRM